MKTTPSDEERRPMMYAAPTHPDLLPIAVLSRLLEEEHEQQARADNRHLPASLRAKAARRAKELRRRTSAHAVARRREIENAPALARQMATLQEPQGTQEFMPIGGTTPMSVQSNPTSPLVMMTVNSARGTWSK